MAYCPLQCSKILKNNRVFHISIRMYSCFQVNVCKVAIDLFGNIRKHYSPFNYGFKCSCPLGQR